jgi:small subunit ribosomal protein S1
LQESIELTEEQQGGTTPPAEAPAEAPAPEQTDAAPLAVVDPAETPSADAPEASAPIVEVEEAPAPAAEPLIEEVEVVPVAAPVAEAPVVEPEAAADESAPAAVAAHEIEDAPAAEPTAAELRRAGPEPTTMEELLAEQDGDIKSFKSGDVVDGTVVRIDKDEILVDIGAKSEGVVSNRELFGRHGESQPALAVGDTVLVYVLQPESPEGHVVLSLRRAGLERKWRSMQEQLEAGVIIEAPVIDHNKGGLIVDCGIRGFVPISQIVDFPRRPQNDQPRDAAQEIAEKLQPFVGRKLRLKILEVNRKANRLILSEKVALYEERREKRDELFSSLQVGQKVTGTVRSIAPFGVFIDLGGIDGLVHKSELSWNKVNNPEAGYRVGEEVEAEVIDINHERGRISLSIRRLQPDPWHSTVADFNVGDIIDGTVTKLVNFGAFVRVRDGLEGLIHISELSHQRVAHPGDVVHEGQNLKLKIISLDSERHRLGLSLKQAEEPPVRVMPEPAAAPAPRPERRPRPDRERERGYSVSDAVQEPEGGIDTTLAAAFAGVREQLAAAEAAEAVPAPAVSAAPEPEQVSEPAPVAEPVAAPEPAPVAEPVAAPEPAPVAEPVAAPEPAPVAEPVAAPEPAPVAEPVAAPEPAPVAAEPEPEPAPVVGLEPVAEAGTSELDEATPPTEDEPAAPSDEAATPA